jgi:TusA-related sulfurtransferase
MEIIKADQIIDTKGLICPMPVVKAKLAMEEMASGQVAKILSTDRGSTKDFPAWCNETGNNLLQTQEQEGLFIFFIQKT